MAKKKQRQKTRKPKFEIEYAEEVFEHLEVIEQKFHRTIEEAIFEQLSYTPITETRNRKPLEPPAPFEATWEIRFGLQNEFRALYEVVAVQPGAVTVATGIDQRWSLEVAGQSIPPRPAFGATTGYDITSAGSATLHYRTSTARALELIGQLLLWLLLALGISRFDTASITRRRRRRVGIVPEAPLLSIHAPVSTSAPIDTPLDATLFASMSDDTVASEPEPANEQHQAGVE